MQGSKHESSVGCTTRTIYIYNSYMHYIHIQKNKWTDPALRAILAKHPDYLRSVHIATPNQPSESSKHAQGVSLLIFVFLITDFTSDTFEQHDMKTSPLSRQACMASDGLAQPSGGL